MKSDHDDDHDDDHKTKTDHRRDQHLQQQMIYLIVKIIRIHSLFFGAIDARHLLHENLQEVCRTVITPVAINRMWLFL